MLNRGPSPEVDVDAVHLTQLPPTDQGAQGQHSVAEPALGSSHPTTLGRRLRVPLAFGAVLPLLPAVFESERVRADALSE